MNDLRERLQDAARKPTRPVDPDRLWARGRRHRTVARAATAVAVVGVLAGAAVGIESVLSTPTSPEIVSRPSVPVDPDPPTVTDAPIVQLEGDTPVGWEVLVAPGDGGRWCAQAVVHGQSSARAGLLDVGDVCDQLVAPDQVPGDGPFGSTSSLSTPDVWLGWGTVDAAATEVVAILDDQPVPGKLIDGPFPFKVWAVALSDQPAEIHVYAEGRLLGETAGVAHGGRQPSEWLTVIDVGEGSEDRLTRQAREFADQHGLELGRDVVVSPAGCWNGLDDQLDIRHDAYVIAIVATQRADLPAIPRSQTRSEPLELPLRCAH